MFSTIGSSRPGHVPTMPTSAACCIDETAAKRGHDYVSLFVDIDQRRVVFVTEGRGCRHGSRVRRAISKPTNGDASHIKQVCSRRRAPPSSRASPTTSPRPRSRCDKFHAVKLVNDVRRQGADAPRARAGAELRRSRYLWLAEPSLSAEAACPIVQALDAAGICRRHASTRSAAVQDGHTSELAHFGMRARCSSTPVQRARSSSRLEPIKEAARTVMRHRDGMFLSWFDSHIATD